jgi:RNA polymerase sigma-70 factor (ECF subfamily)
MITPGEIFSKSDFGTFYNTYYKRFINYALYYVNDTRTAEDITHDAILYCWENRSALPSDTDVLGYVLSAIKNRCLNHLKHLQVEAEYGRQCLELHEWEVRARIMTLEDAHYDDIFTNEIKRIVRNALAQLPEQTRHIFEQHRIKFRSRREIADELGVSLQKIDYHINKANQHLHNELKDYSPLVAIFFQIFFG